MTKACPVCSSRNGRLLHAAAGVPIFMNRLFDSAVEARRTPTGPLEIVNCVDCGFAWNSSFDASLIVYDGEYENDQTHSPAFRAHVHERIGDILSAIPDAEPIDLLEVGCGQGVFLSEAAKQAGSRLRSAEGFDPAWRGDDGGGPGGCIIHKAYFEEKTAGRLRFKPNLVVTRHTIEHVPRPVSFLRTIRDALGADSQARIFVETPSLPWIVENGAMQDLFYEHCSIFSEGALIYALTVSGFDAATVRGVFGGQYLWATAKAGKPARAPRPRESLRVPRESAFATFVSTWRQRLRDASAIGPVAVWGAGAKGVTFSILVDPEGELIDHVIDINPAKQGRFVGGSGARVLSPEQSLAIAPRTIFVMNANYLPEIAQQLTAAGSKAALISIEGPQVSSGLARPDPPDRNGG
ncbi:MAG: methyltransferase domain-containing protein [Alphaproteobacteria bacterium]|nr:methyltransferase domain-containing protein [Alphaproteobacteria bacterium]